MRDRKARTRGSFFFKPAVMLLAGGVIFGAGCGHTPDAGSGGEMGNDYAPSYSPAAPLPETVTGNPLPSPSPEITPLSGTSAEAAPHSVSDEGPPEETGYLISPNDVIAISVLGEEDLSLSVRVSEKGLISFPLLGEIKAVGYTPIQFERKLEELLEKDYLVSPSVNINIKEYGAISVLGQVKKPGSFEIKGRLTVTQAVALAGGLTDIASPNGTKVIREVAGREEIIPVKLKDILNDGNLSGDINLKPGDLIVIPESFF